MVTIVHSILLLLLRFIADFALSVSSDFYGGTLLWMVESF